MKIKRIFKWLGGAVVIVVFLIVLALFVGYWRSTNDCEALTSAQGETMRAIVACDYGTADVLKLANIAKPVPSDNQVLVKVRAASVNPLDWHFLRGTPYVMRMESGLRKPKNIGVGRDFAGTIEAVGKGVTRFKAGDEVFSIRAGAFAEYLCVSEKSLAAKPANVSFEQAAAVPIAGVTALQGLRDQGKLQAGQKVLINGASGGVGTFAVQIAKAMGAEVTGVCSGRNAEMVRALGADHVIDYTQEDFTKGAARYDLILDNVGTQPLAGFRRVLKPNGICVLIGGGGPDAGDWIGPLWRPIKAAVMSPFVDEEIGMMMSEVRGADLAAIAEMMAAGQVKAVIDRRYNLEQVAGAIRYLEKGHARGKVIITVVPEP